MHLNKPHLITIIGPTGIGKTSLSIQLAKTYQTEIISADSRQFFKEMTIGTAVPSVEELNAATHHFIHDRSIFEEFNVGDYEIEALNRLEELFEIYDNLILVGGSGLYVNAVLDGLDNFPTIDPLIRTNLQMELEKGGLVPLQEELAVKDPITYAQMDIDNSQRLLRVLEVCRGTGKTFSSYLGKKKPSRKFKSIKIGLKADRSVMYDRINHRVDQMIVQGLVQEAENLFPHRNLNALQTVGYKELFRHFEGEISLDFAIEEIKKNSRRYAKRQLTWFNKTANVIWFDYQEPIANIVQELNRLIHS